MNAETNDRCKGRPVRTWGMGDSGEGSAQAVPGRNGPVDAVNGIDLEIKQGECFGLLGPNGAGKTTTVEIVEGLNQPDLRARSRSSG